MNSVSLTPTTASIVTGGSASFTATVDVTGSASTAVTWSVSNTVAVTLSTSGNSATVTAVTVPSTPVTITATSASDASKSASATINISAPPAYTLQLTSNAAAVTAGQSTALDVSLANLSGGFNQPVSLSVSGLPSGVTGTFQPTTVTPGQTSRLTLSAAGSAPVTMSTLQLRGDATGLAARTANVSLQVRGASSVRVNAADSTLNVGQSVQATATVRDGANNAMTERSIAWSSSDATKVSVSAAGVMLGVAPGSANITATVDGIADTMLVVVAAPVTTVSFTAPDSQLVQGQSVQTTVVARDASGNVVTGRPVTYNSTAPSVATISASGVITATSSTGFATISASVDGVVGQLPIEVVARVTRVDIATPQSTTLTVGQNLQLQVAAFDANNQVINGRAQSWTTSNPAVATVTPTTGRVTAIAPGPVTITATIEGVSDTQSLTVVAAVASVQVTASKTLVRANESVQLTATPRDAGGNAIPGLSAVWSTTSQTSGRVSAFGVFTGVSVGSTTVTASVNGVTGTLDMCTAFSYSVGSAQLSGASANVCGGAAYFVFSTTSTDFYTVSGSFSDAASVTALGSSRGFGWTFNWQSASTFARSIVMPPGTWASKIASAGSFTFRIVPSLPLCDRTTATYGVSSLPIPISASCPTAQPIGLAAGTYYGSEFYLQELRPGETITVTATSATLVPIIELFNQGRNVIASTISQSGGTQILTYTVSASSGPIVPLVIVSTRVSGLASGTIAVSISGPGNLGF